MESAWDAEGEKLRGEGIMLWMYRVLSRRWHWSNCTRVEQMRDISWKTWLRQGRCGRLPRSGAPGRYNASRYESLLFNSLVSGSSPTIKVKSDYGIISITYEWRQGGR